MLLSSCHCPLGLRALRVSYGEGTPRLSSLCNLMPKMCLYAIY